jgi:hypothetical protein
MEKPPTIESVIPCSGQYSFRRDLRLNAWLLVTTVLYLALRTLLTRHPEWSPLARGLVALVPLLPATLYLRDWVRFVGKLDELQRRVQMEAHLFAAWGTLIVGIALSTLNAQGVLKLLPHGLGLGGVMVILFPLWLVGVAIANCRYK